MDRAPSLPATGLILTVVVFVLYGGTLDNPFVFDSVPGIVQNPWIRDLRHIPRFFQDPRTLTVTPHNAGYRPVLQTTFALCYAVSGTAPWSWRLLNVILHLCCALGLLALVRAILGSGRIRNVDWLDPEAGDRVAWAAALIFLVHPTATGCVNYMWARSTLLVSSLILPATVLYARAVGGSGSRDFILSIALYALALFAKVEAISALGVFFLLEIFLRRTPADSETPGSGPGSPVGPGSPISSSFRIGTVLGVTIVYLLIRTRVLPPGVQEWVDPEVTGVTSWDYLLTQVRVWWYYVGNLLVPHGTILEDLSWPISRSILEPAVLHALTGWALVIACLLRTLTTSPQIAILGLWFFIHLSPHSSVMPIMQPLNGHRPYLASAGLIALACTGSFVFVRNRFTAPHRIWTRGILAVSIFLGALTILQNRVWDDPLTLWAMNARLAPGCPQTQGNLGAYLLDAGRLDEARTHLLDAARLDPYPAIHRVNLGLLREREGDLDRARDALDEAVRVAVDPQEAYEFRASLRMRHGDLPGARADLVRALSLDPRDPRALSRLIRLLWRMGERDEARRVARDPSSVDPGAFERLIRELEGRP